MNYSDSTLFADSGAFDTPFFKFSDNSANTAGITPASSLEDDSTLQRRKEAHLFMDSEIEESKTQFNLTENPDFHKISKNYRSDVGILDRVSMSRLAQKNDNLSSIIAGLPPLVIGSGGSNKSSTGSSPTDMTTLSAHSQPLYQRGPQSRSPSNYSSHLDANDFLRGPSSMSQDSYGRPPMQQNGYPMQYQQQNSLYGNSNSSFSAYGPAMYQQQQQQQQQYQQPKSMHGPGSLYGGGGNGNGNNYDEYLYNRQMKFSPKVYPNQNSPATNASYLNLVNSVEERDKDVYVVEFKKSSKEFVLGYRAPASIAVGDAVIVSADRGEDLGVVTHIFPMKEFLYRKSMLSQQMGTPEFDKSMGRILRLATSSEIMMLSKKVYDENEVVEYTRELVHNVYRLDLRIVDAEYQFDRHKLTVYYEAEYRIDFRDLVKALYSTFKARIWMEHAGGGGLM